MDFFEPDEDILARQVALTQQEKAKTAAKQVIQKRKEDMEENKNQTPATEQKP
jgi:hypothetical protein